MAAADTATDLVLSERRGAVQWITLNRESKRNALNDEVAGLIAAGVREAQAQDAVRAIVVTGAGDKAFCAGGDLQASSADSPFEVDPARPANPIIELFKTFEQTTKPTIARVNGHALAGGMGLMCACDVAIAAGRRACATGAIPAGTTTVVIREVAETADRIQSGHERIHEFLAEDGVVEYRQLSAHRLKRLQTLQAVEVSVVLHLQLTADFFQRG